MRALLVLLLCLAAQAPRPPERPRVYASFYPLAWLAERLGGDALEISCPVPAGEDPATWAPERELVARMQAADLVLVHGASFESWLEFTSLPLARTVVGTRGLRERLMDYRAGAVHSHGPDGAPAHRGTDAHTWLDPLLALEEARVVLAALTRILPGRGAELEQRFAALHVDLTRLHDRLRALAPLFAGRTLVASHEAEAGRGEADRAPLFAGRTLVASHPAYEYLARSYGWHIENVLIDPEGPLAEPARARLAALRAESGARLVLWESEPSADVRAAVEALGLACVLYSPCETLDDESRAAGLDFLAVMNANVERLERALRDL